MPLHRPDLSDVTPEIRAYIESLEAELERLRPAPRPAEPPLEVIEPETTFQVVTISAAGLAKRTPRHLYGRQRRGGMGIFDLESAESDPPAQLLIADESEMLLLLSNLARAYRLPVHTLAEAAVRARGRSLSERLILDRGERIVLALPCPNSGYVAMVNKRGDVRRMRHYTFRETMEQGTLLYSLSEFGPPVAACLTPGDGDLFLATRQGRAIRFPEQAIPLKGCPGIRLGEGDAVVALTAVRPESGVFLLGADGSGTIRRMSGFGANKAPGAGGKTAFTTERLVAAVTVAEGDDLFAISRLSKLIRFAAAEVPAKEGVVQGVHCIALRADEAVACAVGRVAEG